MAWACSENARAPAWTEEDGHAALKAADDLAGRHRVAEALAEVERALERAGERDSPAKRKLLERRGTLLLSLSRPAEAARAIEKAGLPAPGGTGAARWLAQAYLESGEPSKAVEVFAGLEGKDRLDCLPEEGKALVESGKTAEGIHAIAAGLLHDPWKESAYLAYGRALVRAGREKEAAPFLERHRVGESLRKLEDSALAFEYRGDIARAHLARARAERSRGRLQEAIELLHAALRQKPDLGDAVLELGRISIFLCRPDDALDILRKLPRNPAVLAVLGEAEEAAGNLTEAAAAYREAISGDPALVAAAEGLLRVEARRRGEEGDAGKEGLHALRKSARDRMLGKPLSRSIEDLVYLVEGLAASGRTSDARALSLLVVRIAPPSGDLVLASAELHDDPSEAFIRLWLLDRVKSPPTEERFRKEAGQLGLDPDRLRSLLARGR
jgi:predicted Zn-dependent protease